MISIVMAYHSRAFQFMNTLDSYVKYYDPSTIELCVVEDHPSTGDPMCERILSRYPFRYKYEVVDRRNSKWRNPAPLYNRAARLASHEVIALTNPENLHMGPVLNHAMGSIRDGVYLVYACAMINFVPGTLEECEQRWNREGSFDRVGPSATQWYIHSIHYHRYLHFMSVIMRSDYWKAGGFDEEYEDGYCYEDDDFVERLKSIGMSLEIIDDPFVVHQFHDRRSHSVIVDGTNGLDRNMKLFESKWGQG